MTRSTRILALFAAAFTVGLMLPGNFPGPVPRWIAAGLLFLLALYLHNKSSSSAKRTTFVLLLLWITLGWIRSWQPTLSYPHDKVWIEGRVRVPVERRATGTRVRLALDRWSAGETGGSFNVGAVVTLHSVPRVKAGDRIRLTGQLQPLESARNPGGFNERAYWAIRGVQFRIVKVKSVQDLGVQGIAGKFGRFIGNARESVKQRLSDVLDPAVLPLGEALLVGDRSGWDEPTRDTLARSGLMHLFAISGLHVGLLWAILLSLLVLLRLPRAVRTPVLLILLWFYAVFTGGNPPVLRATVIFTIFEIGQVLQRQHRAGYTLALAWIGLLAWRPFSIGDAGFQLTFAGAAGSIWAGGQFKDLIQVHRSGTVHRAAHWTFRALRGALYALLVSCGAVLATTPIVIAHFGRLPWMGPILTVISVPLLTGILICGWATVLLRWVPLIGTLFGDALWAFLHILRLIAGQSSLTLPLSDFLPLSSAVFTAIVLLVLLFWAPRLKTLGLRGMLIAVLVVVTGAVWADAWMPDGKIKVGVLDVGQGDAVLVRRGDRAFLVDTGSGKMETVLQQLRLTGVRSLDLLVITHGDKDHAGGAAEIVREFPVKMGLVGPGTIRDKAGKEAVQAMVKRGVPVFVGRARGIVDLGRLGKLTILWPTDEFMRRAHSDDNDLSQVLVWNAGNSSALFPGDAGKRVERLLVESGQLPDVDLLLAGHHGSRYSTTSAWLEALHPETIAISAGRNNPYGHPAPEMLQRVRDFGVFPRRTDLEGAILFTPANGGFRSLSPWQWW